MFGAIIAALGMTADGLAEGLYAVRHRFSARVASVAFAIGAALGWFYQVVTPITFTVESITVAAQSVKKPPQIFYVVALSAVPSVALGLLGLYSSFVSWLDPAVVAGVIVGVGVILTRVGVGYLRERPAVAVPAVVAGLLVYALTENLVLVILASMILGTVARYVLPQRFQPGAKEEEVGAGEEEEEEAEEEEELKEEKELGGGEEKNANAKGHGRFGPRIRPIRLRWREMFAPAVLVGAFSLFALRTGSVVSYDRVNSELAGKGPELDGMTVIAGVASLASGLLGGPPIETTPAPMAATAQPVFSTVLFMALMAVVTFVGLVGRLGRYIPLQAIAGFLVVLGVPVILPENLPSVAEAPLAGGVALIVTALSNPFYGLLAGQGVALFWPA